jgi:predicted MFS family arabinose efflux permease
MLTRSDAANARARSGTREQWATRLVFLAVGFAIAAWAPLVPFAKARLGIDDGALGLLLLCLGGGSILAMPVTGVMATRYGCRAILMVGVVVFSAVLPVLAVASDMATMAIALAVFGAAIGTVDVTMNIQAVIVEKDSRRAMMSGFHGLYSLGGILGAGGVSALLLGGATPLVATACFSLLAVLALVVAVPGLLPFGNDDGGAAPPFALPRGFVTFIGLLCFIVFLAEGAVLDWSAVFLVSERGFDPAAGGYGYALFAVAMTAGRLAGDKVVTRLGGVRVLTLGGLLAAAGFALPLLLPSQAASLMGFLLVGLGASNAVPVLFTIAGRQTEMPPSLAVAAVTTLGYAGILAGPALIGFVAQLTDLSFAFGLLALAMVFVGLSGRVARR